MSGGGAGGSGTQKFEWNEGTAPYWEQALGMGNYISGLGLNGAPTKQYQAYPGQRIAGINSAQTAALDRITALGLGGNQTTDAANQQTQATLGDEYLTGSKANPFAVANPYGLENPYFDSVVNQGMTDITDKYKQGTSADTTRMFNLSGAFGGSAHQNKMANNEAGLARELGNYNNQMRSGQYDRSANLYENYLNRGAGTFEGERGRQMGAVGAGQNAQNLDLQRYNALLGVGDVYRGHEQDYLNQGYNDWQEQQNYPYKQLDYMTGLLGRAQGGMSPNMTQQQAGYSASPFSQLLGAGLLGYGAFGGGG